MRAGEAALHHVMLPHASAGNASPVRWRRAVAIRYVRASARFGPKVSKMPSWPRSWANFSIL
jgi:hypothetical protein